MCVKNDSKIIYLKALTTPCDHRNIALNQKSRQSYCRDCKEKIDPFEALTLIARRGYLIHLTRRTSVTKGITG